MQTKASTYRLQYLDWLRGLAAVIMLQGHCFDAFTKPSLRQSGPYTFSQFAGGMPPALFLFLTGVTLSFLMDSSERKGIGPMARVITAFSRSGYLFFLAFAFRLQLFVFSFPGDWHDLFRVDILNCMGFSIAVLSVMALFKTVERVRLCAVLGLAIAMAAPLVSQLDLPKLHWMVRSYIVPDYRYFSFFPWAAFLAFGMSAGSAIRAVPQEATERVMQWVALVGGSLILICQYFANQPYSIYPKSDFWLNSPAQVLTKLGVTLLMLAFAFLWTRYGAAEGWSWIRQFGTTSLLVYWVHIELVYGRWLWFLKNNLTILQTVISAVVIILLMLGLATAKSYRQRIVTWIEGMRWPFLPKTDRVPGD
jgi:uncharacterized membrane protein